MDHREFAVFVSYLCWNPFIIKVLSDVFKIQKVPIDKECILQHEVHAEITELEPCSLPSPKPGLLPGRSRCCHLGVFHWFSIPWLLDPSS